MGTNANSLAPVVLSLAVAAAIAGCVSSATAPQFSEIINSQTDLMTDSELNQQDAVLALLKSGADVNAKRQDGATALILAARVGGHRDVVKALVIGGADVNAINDKGMSALQESAINGDADVAQILIKGGADINHKSNDGATALILASLYGQVDLVQLLLDGGADVRTKDARGLDAIHEAAREFNLDIVSMLLQRQPVTQIDPDEPPAADRYDDVSVLSAQLADPLPATLSEANLALVSGDDAVSHGDTKGCTRNFNRSAELWGQARQHFGDVADMYGREAALRTGKEILSAVLLAALQQSSAIYSARQNAQMFALSHAKTTSQYVAMNNALQKQISRAPIVPAPTVSISVPTLTPAVAGGYAVFALGYVPGLENDLGTLQDTFNNRKKIAGKFAEVTRASSKCCLDSGVGHKPACYADLGKAVGIN